MLKSIQAARASACLIVLISHAAAVVMLPKYWNVVIFGDWLRIGRTGVDLFFVISGFIIFSVHHRDWGNPSRVAGFTYSRISRIYPYYWIYAAAMTTLVALGMFGPPHLFDLPALVDFATLLHVSADQNPVGVAWSLYFEILFYLAFAVAILHRRLGIALMIGALGIVTLRIAYDVARPGQPAAGPLWGNYALFLEFLGGYWAWRAQRWLGPAGAGGLLAAGCLVLVIAIAVVDGAGFFDRIPASRLLYGLAYTLIVAALVAIERHRPIAVPPAVVRIGDASYSIYLAHFPTISLAAKVLLRVPLVATHPYLAFILLSLVSLSAGLAAHELLERPILRKLRRRRPVGRAVPA